MFDDVMKQLHEWTQKERELRPWCNVTLYPPSQNQSDLLSAIYLANEEMMDDEARAIIMLSAAITTMPIRICVHYDTTVVGTGKVLFGWLVGLPIDRQRAARPEWTRDETVASYVIAG